MNTRSVQLALIAAGVLGLIVAVRVAAWPLARVNLPTAEPLASGSVPADPGRRVVAESVALVVSRDPFRIGRRPLLPAYDPLRLAEQSAPPPPRPTLTLVGMVNGRAPSAVIEGIPGVEGSRVLRVGDVVAGLQIKQIGTNRVVIVGMDTTWVLEVREPWKN